MTDERKMGTTAPTQKWRFTREMNSQLSRDTSESAFLP